MFDWISYMNDCRAIHRERGITKSKWKNNHELSVARSVAVFEALKRRGVPESTSPRYSPPPGRW